jgi:hypothetical protein
MKKASQHIIYNSDGTWSLRKSGATKATKKFRTKQSAISYGREIAKRQGATLYVHTRNGTVEKKSSFGSSSPKAKRIK